MHMDTQRALTYLISSIFIILKICNCSEDVSLIKKSTENVFYFKSGSAKNFSNIFNLETNSHSHKKEFVRESSTNGNLRIALPNENTLEGNEKNEIIVISALSESLSVTHKKHIKNVATYFVFVPAALTQIEDELKTQNYVGHIAYVRNTQGKKSVEWDFIEDPIKKVSIASAFLDYHSSPKSSIKGRRFNTLLYFHKLVSSNSISSSKKNAQGRNFETHNRETKINKQKRSTSRRKKSKAKKAETLKIKKLEVFTGIGGCKLETINITQSNVWNTTTRIIFYLNILQIACIPGFIQEAEQLLSKGYISEGTDLRYDLTLENPIFSSIILDDPQEWTDLVSVIFLYAFSNAYSDETETIALEVDDEFSSDTELSFTAKTLTNFVFKVLDFMGTQVFYHTVKLANALIDSLKLRIQSNNRLFTNTQNADKSMQKSQQQDQLQMAGIILFMQNKLLQSLAIGEHQISDMFSEYFANNHKTIENSLSLFTNVHNSP